MGLQIRDDRQMKALTDLSQDQFDHKTHSRHLHQLFERYRRQQSFPIYHDHVVADVQLIDERVCRSSRLAVRGDQTARFRIR